MAFFPAKASREPGRLLRSRCRKPPDRPASTSTMDFLVIDDDKLFREATCLLIEDEGHYAETAASAEVGLTRLREDKFDAALLDLNLGRESGLALLPQILK